MTNKICIEKITHKIIVLKDKKNPQKMIFSNPHEIHVEKISVDGCYINDETEEKCDFLVKTELEHYVELKGSDPKKALNQIFNTIKLIGDTSIKNKLGFIICNRVPSASTSTQLLEAKARKHGLILKIKNTQHEHTLEK